MIKNHLSYAALGAVAGVLASVVVDKGLARRAAGKPAIPSGLTAVASGLLPLASAVLKDMAMQVDAIVDDIERSKDGEGDSAGENDEPVTGGPGPSVVAQANKILSDAQAEAKNQSQNANEEAPSSPAPEAKEPALANA